MADLKQIADQLLAAFNTHDAAAVAQLYAERQVTMGPMAPEPIRGRQAKREMLTGFFTAFPDLKLDMPFVLVSGSHIVCDGTLKGTHTGPILSHEGEIPPTGRAIQIPLAFILRVASDGLIEEDRTYYDNAAFLTQLGLT